MRRLLFLALLVYMLVQMLSSCSDETGANPKFHYIDMNCVIVEKLPIVPIGKRGSKAFLIRSVKDTTLYT